ncbi:hypothetical protein ACFRQM_37995 [Streptomyces sp. NPDC056831]|uniref:hypothetical protein n=1 Tax=Streptomyces sp. NPDC056831 TaxID=3345954 RepID=UPI0036A204D1
MTGRITTGESRPEVGRSRMRKEDARLVTGRTTSASPAYREHLVRVLTRRAVLAAAGTE